MIYVVAVFLWFYAVAMAMAAYSVWRWRGPWKEDARGWLVGLACFCISIATAWVAARMLP